MARLLFTRRANLGSALIRAASWSGWSHVQVVDGDVLWGASFPQGVVREDLAYRLALASRAAIVTIPTQDDQRVVEFAHGQLGKPYDPLGVVGLGLHRDWQDPSSWWCSEFAAAAVQEGGTRLFRDGALNRVTPQHLFMLPYEVEVLK